jgi:hypothetical protein
LDSTHGLDAQIVIDHGKNTINNDNKDNSAHHRLRG